jgi:bifunctional DNA-binding transcriptional regulator/antitoxin component of YhaV-PrlF toxin-antitoxin module
MRLLGESRVQEKFRTVIPREVRVQLGAREGDFLQWSFERNELRIRLRRRVSLQDIVAIGSRGGDAVRSKRSVEGRESRTA